VSRGLQATPSFINLLSRLWLWFLRTWRRWALGPWYREVYPPSPFHGFLETPPRKGAAGMPLTVAGWLVSTGSPIKALTVSVGGSVPEPIPLRIRRADIGRIFPGVPAAASCGFRRTLLPPVSPASSVLELRVWASLENGRRVCCFSRRIQVARARLPQGAPPRGRAGLRQPESGVKGLPVLPTDWAATLSRELADLPPIMEGPPDCSVIIPVLGRCALTYDCLRSLLRVGARASFEIIVVDNGSPDETREVVRAFGARVRLLSNPRNLGFVTACNQGAKEAHGTYLVFLNNDTEVLAGWLDRLVETAEQFEKVGAVGAKLVYPSGRLQEAGGIVFADGTAANFGRSDDPDDPRYAYLREVDYCSAACLMVPKRVFEEVGGFDPRYSPGYYEDTDLGFALRERGYRVLYQPLSEVVHREGGTAGTDVSQGLKRHQEINREAFVAKWATALSRQRLAGEDDLEAAAERRLGPRILFIDYQIPKFDEDSGSFRAFGMVRILSQLGCRVSFMLPLGAPFDEYCRILGGSGVRVVSEKHVLDEVASAGYDLVVVSRAEMAERYIPVLRRLAPTLPVVFDTVDVHFVRAEREAELRDDEELRELARSIRELELAMARLATRTLTVTEPDRQRLLQEDPTLDIEILPNIHPLVPVVPPRAGRRALMFIGGFAHPPNVDAMLYFRREVLPLVERELGSLEVLIVGSKAPPEIQGLASPRIQVTGKVPETGPYYARSMVFVAPLRFGAGMKGKIGEALSYGVPVVTTTIGAEGMGLVDGETALLADEPQAFATAVVRLWRDAALWEELSRRGRQYVEERFSPAAVRSRVSRLRQLALTASPVVATRE
jgi:O-antigen biosynthesis protein